MKNHPFIFLFFCFLLFNSCKSQPDKDNNTPILDDRFYLKIVDLEKENLTFYWKDDKNKAFQSFSNLKEKLQKNNDSLVYAMNGGMFLKDYSPQGLYIEKGRILKPLDTVQEAFGNFYLQPNGVFGITKAGKAIISKSNKTKTENLEYATQSGPMLVIDGKLHPAFNKESKNLHIRNAVGILPDGRLVFAISKEKINFYDMATFFKIQGCKNALYLDGFVSRIYDPKNGIEQMDGNFGVLIAITK